MSNLSRCPICIKYQKGTRLAAIVELTHDYPRLTPGRSDIVLAISGPPSVAHIPNGRCNQTRTAEKRAFTEHPQPRDHHMAVRVAGVEMVDRDPIEPRAEVLLHLSHHIQG